MNIKQILRQNFFINAYLKKNRILQWINNGRSLPVPHDVKQLSVLYHALANNLDTLVETGTFLGDMVWAQRDYFEKRYIRLNFRKSFMNVRKSGLRILRISN